MWYYLINQIVYSLLGDTIVTVDAKDNSGNISNASFTITVIGPIQNLQADTTPDSLTASWDAHAGKTRVSVSEPYSTTSAASLTTGFLPASTEYRIVVIPDGDETKRGAIQVTTLDSDAPRSDFITQDIHNLYVVPTESSMRITWDDPAASTQAEYTVVVTQVGVNENRIQETTNSTAIEIDGLFFNTKYRVDVSDANNATKHDSIFVKTLRFGFTPDHVKPGAVQNIKVHPFASEFFITWDNDFDSYEIRIFEPINVDEIFVDITSNSNYDFLDLKPDTDYTIVVIPDGDATRQATLEVTTADDPQEFNSFTVPGYDPSPVPPASKTLTVPHNIQFLNLCNL